MRKLLIFIIATATVVSAGCGSFSEGMSSVADAVPNALNKAPLIYRPTIQQGNVVKQEQVNELRPGMSKRQVKFLLGTPMLNDVFHANRWDYVYTIGVGSTPEETRRPGQQHRAHLGTRARQPRRARQRRRVEELVQREVPGAHLGSLAAMHRGEAHIAIRAAIR